jgi:hypothetical protein
MLVLTDPGGPALRVGAIRGNRRSDVHCEHPVLIGGAVGHRFLTARRAIRAEERVVELASGRVEPAPSHTVVEVPGVADRRLEDISGEMVAHDKRGHAALAPRRGCLGPERRRGGGPAAFYEPDEVSQVESRSAGRHRGARERALPARSPMSALTWTRIASRDAA